ncbi:glucose-6-phosphate 1-epimerase isoform X2 [Canna indica]|uniref:glucose-6-phosphate 1-epimerase n=1 Tax=Canna indica TaxID=4628 RepID=A0AAQ3JT62_9LILI|nr:glucose-6-phosphate 1-epimerase isoform X2 [Canna indica]
MPWSVVNDGDGLPRIILTEPAGSSAVISLYGGQVNSWKNKKREELLFVSAKGIAKSHKPIRGGIPICFPQFGNLGSPERIGFARNRLWELDTCPSPLPRSNDQSSVDLILKSTSEDLKTWPHSFELRLRVILSPSKLTLIPRVRNTSSKPFSFTFAIRNHISISDVSEVRVEGLETLDYFDNLESGERFTEQADAVTFDGEVDRVYLRTPTKIAIIDHEKKRTLVLRKEWLPDAGCCLVYAFLCHIYDFKVINKFDIILMQAGVWNPWEKKAKGSPDFGDEDYKSMLCIDSAFAESPIVLKPLEEWTGYQELCSVSSSYASGQLDPRKVLSLG